MSDERLVRQMGFLAELDKVKGIFRQTRLMDDSRYENDAEHSWHMSVFAVALAEYGPAGVDVLRAVTMCLIHDVVEIDAGDAYAYDPAALVGQVERERKAAERIFGMLPGEQGAEMKGLWEEFEARETKEAKYAGALDRVQGVLNNYHAGGGSWKAHGVKRSQVMRRIEPVREGTPKLWEYLKVVVEEAVGKGWIMGD